MTDLWQMQSKEQRVDSSDRPEGLRLRIARSVPMAGTGLSVQPRVWHDPVGDSPPSRDLVLSFRETELLIARPQRGHLMRLSAALVVASERRRRGDSLSVSAA